MIHEIIDAFEAELAQSKSGKGNRKERRNSKRGCNSGSSELKRLESSSGKNELSESDSVVLIMRVVVIIMVVKVLLGVVELMERKGWIKGL